MILENWQSTPRYERTSQNSMKKEDATTVWLKQNTKL